MWVLVRIRIVEVHLSQGLQPSHCSILSCRNSPNSITSKLWPPRFFLVFILHRPSRSLCNTTWPCAKSNWNGRHSASKRRQKHDNFGDFPCLSRHKLIGGLGGEKAALHHACHAMPTDGTCKLQFFRIMIGPLGWECLGAEHHFGLISRCKSVDRWDCPIVNHSNSRSSDSRSSLSYCLETVLLLPVWFRMLVHSRWSLIASKCNTICWFTVNYCLPCSWKVWIPHKLRARMAQRAWQGIYRTQWGQCWSSNFGVFMSFPRSQCSEFQSYNGRCCDGSLCEWWWLMMMMMMMMVMMTTTTTTTMMMMMMMMITSTGFAQEKCWGPNLLTAGMQHAECAGRACQDPAVRMQVQLLAEMSPNQSVHLSILDFRFWFAM